MQWCNRNRLSNDLLFYNRLTFLRIFEPSLVFKLCIYSKHFKTWRILWWTSWTNDAFSTLIVYAEVLFFFSFWFFFLFFVSVVLVLLLLFDRLSETHLHIIPTCRCSCKILQLFAVFSCNYICNFVFLSFAFDCWLSFIFTAKKKKKYKSKKTRRKKINKNA